MRVEGGRWQWVGWEKVVVGKWKQLYLNNNKKKREREKEIKKFIKKRPKSTSTPRLPLLTAASPTRTRLATVGNTT